MKKSTLSKLSFAILVTFALSGCHLTSRALDNIDAVPETVITDENIYSFGFTKPDSKNLPPNRLVLLTEKTAYVTDITPDNEMVKVLRTTELSKQFEVVTSDNTPKKLGIYSYFSNPDTFSAYSDHVDGKERICMAYRFEPNTNPALKKRETAILTQLGFKLATTAATQQQKLLYARCYNGTQGKIYAMKTPLPSEYRFETPVVVRVESQKGDVGLTATGLASTIILTPFAIVGDLIMLPVMPFVGPFIWPRGTKI